MWAASAKLSCAPVRCDRELCLHQVQGRLPVRKTLKLNMQAQSRDEHRPAVAVVAGIIDMLQTERGINSAPGVQRVKRFDNVFPAVIQTAVSQKEAIATESEILLMDAGDSVGDKSKARAVPFAMPRFSVEADADFRRLVRFGVHVGLVLTFVPSPSAENAEPAGERLLEIRAEAVFDRGLKRVEGDFRLGRDSG